MGSVESFETSENRGGRLGKINAPLIRKLKSVKWGECKIGDLFEVNSYKRRFDANKVVISDIGYPYVVRTSLNNGVRGLINEDRQFLNDGNTISFGQDTATLFYQDRPYFTGDKIKILKAKNKRFNKNNAQFFIAAMKKSFSSFSWGTTSFSINIIKNQKITLPILKTGKIDFDFIDGFIAELEAQRYAELDAYLTVTRLKDYVLTAEEQHALDSYKDWEWKTFNLKKLFGKSTRGKRLKSADRIPGVLPFVTAGETDEGISGFIGNDVTVFSENTITIDMFGSAKYRNYKYGGDDHIAVVHTETLPKLASIFVTSAIHKSSHNGQFDYSKNFYAKDADALDIQLPSRNGQPDYDRMSTFVSAIQKVVIKDVVLFADRKIRATKEIMNK